MEAIQQYDKEYLLAESKYIANLITSEIGNANNVGERLSTVFSVVLVTAEILQEKCGLNISVQDLKKTLTEHLKSLVTDSLPLSDRAYDVILEWIANHQDRIQGFKGCEFSGALAKYTAENEIAIQSTILKKYLEDRKFQDINVVAKSLKKAGLLHTESPSGLQARIKFSKMTLNCYRIVLREEKEISNKGTIKLVESQNLCEPSEENQILSELENTTESSLETNTQPEKPKTVPKILKDRSGNSTKFGNNRFSRQ